MRLQLLSDLHLETEDFEPEPAAGADLLVLAGDIDSTWRALDRFRGWPVPVLFVAGNHEFDQRDISSAWPALRERCARLGLIMLERESLVLADPAGRRIRFVATTRWCDFDLYGPARRERAMRAASYFMDVMRATRNGRPFDAEAVRDEPSCRDRRGSGMKPLPSPTSAPVLPAPTRATARRRARRVFAMPTMTCWRMQPCGSMGICTAGGTTRCGMPAG